MEVLKRLMPAVGDLVQGRYELIKELGRGGFGVVYQARQTSLDQLVAVKILLPHVLASEDLVRRFEREVEVVKHLRHPNTIRILDSGRTEHRLPYYVMEYITGGTLGETLKEGAFSPARSVRIVSQVLKSLAEAHSRNIVHRDLKPANIMLSQIVGETDHVKVLDFGIAKALNPDRDGGDTQTGQILGTPFYVSPEQARGERDVDQRSDIYTMGLILAECVSGQRVVAGGSSFEIVAQHAFSDPLPFSPALAQSPLWPVIEMATQKDRRLRYQSAMEMVLDLQDLSKLSSAVLSFSSAELERQPAPSAQLNTPAPYAGETLLHKPDTEVSMTSAEGVRRTNRLLIAGAVAAVVALAAIGSVVLIGPGGAEIGEFAESVGAPNNNDNNENNENNDNNDNNDNNENSENSENEPLAAVDSESRDPIETLGIDLAVVVQSTVALASERTQAALPGSHEVGFEGLEGATVSFDGRELGTVPFSFSFPDLAIEMELTFARRGYRSDTQTVSLQQHIVTVDLRRRRRQVDGQTETVPEQTPNHFQVAPIYE